MPNLPLYELTRALSEADVQSYQSELANLQGNILKSHGRGAAVHLFLTFKPKKMPQVKQFLRHFGPTSAIEQREQARRYNETGELAERFACLGLSARGYAYLKLPTTHFSPEFRQGMRRRAQLADPSPEKWESKFQRPLHALIILADDRVEMLTEQLSKLREKLKPFADVGVEFGLTMRNESKNPIEHFGYADGISQPLFYESDLEGTPLQWNPSAGPNLVLVKDPHSHLPAACGTYWVFRKLEQNVAGFEAQETQLDKKGIDLDDPGAMAVGRFEDGTPLALHKKERTLRQPENDFTYARDPEGNKCPVFGHVRILNPRRESDKPHRIARRGITYGDPTPPSDKDYELPERGVGLLFQCCQADIANQFEYLQQLANGQGDPLIGQPESKYRLQFPTAYGKSGKRVSFDFKRFVTLKGGEYFFIPSISFLEDLR